MIKKIQKRLPLCEERMAKSIYGPWRIAQSVIVTGGTDGTNAILWY